MPNIRILSVAFDAHIESWELPQFRAAIAAKVGFQHDLFHNHDAESGGFHYRMPLIQYKQAYGRPMLVCVNEGIEELQHFFSKPDWTLHLNGRPLPIRIEQLQINELPLGSSDTLHRYHIRHWIGLNEENYAAYQSATGMVERLALLEKVLKNQVVGLLHQLHVKESPPVILRLLERHEERWVSFKKIKMLAFSLEFSCNVLLPNYLGLGKGCSIGWGVVKGLGERGKDEPVKL